jgi:hypothetical protein
MPLRDEAQVCQHHHVGLTAHLLRPGLPPWRRVLWVLRSLGAWRLDLP